MIPDAQGANAKTLRIRTRPDIHVKPQLYEGQTHYVVKDPIGMRYFRFREEEYFLIQQFDGVQRLEDIRVLYERRYRPQKIRIEELARFASQLTQAGIAHVDTPKQGQVLYERFKKMRFKKRLATWTNILYIKLPGIDPDKILTWMLPYTRWIYHPIVVSATVLLWLAALIWLAAHYTAFQARLPEFQAFFNWRNALYFWAALGVVKVIHEFGHGLTCKYYGGECHEMGALFLVLSPCLYCDVSDSWMLPNKWHRVLIAAAGIYVELTMAALCTFIWWFSVPGLLNNLALSTMFVCSVNTVMFNANPLLRFDGYYALMDMLEIPNLRTKANRFFQNVIGKICIGLNTDMETWLPRSRRTLFFIFAVASYLYRWFISFSILWFLYRFLRPYKLGSISALLATGALVSLLVIPTYRFGKFVYEHRRTSAVSKLRMSLTALVLGLTGAFLFLVPFPHSVDASFVLMPRNPEYIWVQVEGTLDEQWVSDGDPTPPGTRLAKLINPSLRQQKMELDRQATEYQLQANALRNASDLTRLSEARIAQERAQRFSDQAGKVEADLEKLNLIVTRSGDGQQILQPPKPEQLGRLLERGTVFGIVANPKLLEARLVIDQKDRDLINHDQPVELKLYSNPLDTIDGKLTQPGNVNAENLPQELSNLWGGEVATKEDPLTGEQKAISTVYHAVVEVDNELLLLKPGLRGRAKIEAKELALAYQFWRWVTHTFHFEA